jgi:Skp family chaperone for outer membrane proteins
MSTFLSTGAFLSALANALWLQLALTCAALAAITFATGGVAFWATRPGNVVLAIVLTLVTTHNVTHRLDGSVALAAETAAQRRRIGELEADATAQRDIAAAAAARESAAQDRSKTLQTEVQAYAKKLESRAPSARCALDDDDVERLRRIGR